MMCLCSLFVAFCTPFLPISEKSRTFAEQKKGGLPRPPLKEGDYREWSSEPCVSVVVGEDTHAPRKCTMRDGMQYRLYGKYIEYIQYDKYIQYKNYINYWKYDKYINYENYATAKKI